MVWEVSRSIPLINVAIENNQVKYEPTIIEIDGKIHEHFFSILTDPCEILSYINEKLVELFKL